MSPEFFFARAALHPPCLDDRTPPIIDDVSGHKRTTMDIDEISKFKADTAGEKDLDAVESYDRHVLAQEIWDPREDQFQSVGRAEAAVNRILDASGKKRIALLEYQITDHTNPTYLHDLELLFKVQARGMIDRIGLIDEDAAHLEMVLDTGMFIATIQTSCSIMDRRIEHGRLGEVCRKHGVAILAYGVLLGGFVSEKWLDQPEPTVSECGGHDFYLSLIKATGGWDLLQSILRALKVIAMRHGVSIAAVATRYVLDIPAVESVADRPEVAAQSNALLGRSPHTSVVRLEVEDKIQIARAQSGLKIISDNEYRELKSSTSTEDASSAPDATTLISAVEDAVAKGFRVQALSGSKWEPICGYCRAVRTGNLIRVSGTTATSPLPSSVALGGSSARSQTVAIFDIIERSLRSLGASLADVVRTRIMIRHKKYCDEVSLAHGAVFQRVGVLPANTLIVVGLIEEEFLVEVEAEAEVGSGNIGVVTL